MLEDLDYAKMLLDLGFQIQITKEEKLNCIVDILYSRYINFTYENYIIIEVSDTQVFVKVK